MGHPGAQDQLGERLRARGRVDRRLPHDGVAAQQRRHDVPGRHRHREVPGGDHHHDADRLPEGEQLLVRHLRRHGLAVEAPALPEEEAAGVDDLLHLAAGLGQRLADLARHQAGQRLGVGLDEVPQVRDDAAADRRGHVRPVRCRRPCGGAGVQQVGGAGEAHLGDHLVEVSRIRRAGHGPGRSRPPAGGPGPVTDQ